ncbi:MAG: ATP phosphoribosyltransferase [Nannocystaceae bacterium]
MDQGLTIALPKGRILGDAAALLGRAGLGTDALRGDDRRLSIPLPGGHRALLVKPIDVPTYVEYGVAALGVAGGDTLREQARDLYEPVDLGIGRCRLVVAEPRDRPSTLQRGMTVRVATKYPRLARAHYLARGIDPEVIELGGSVELAAVTGLADQIVDLVESGETLRQNGLREVDTVLEVTSRLIVNPAALKLHAAQVTAVIEAIRAVVAGVSEGLREVS